MTDLGRAHEFHGVQPVLFVREVAAAAAYFRDVLGFDLDFLHGDPPVHGRVMQGDGTYGQPIYIHLSTAPEAELRPSGELRIHVGRDLDGLIAAYRARGVAVDFEPVTQPWGLREFAVRTPDGHRLRFCGEA
jgi:catechol 2,3-dioxygenase-like lactoylglutathione lyase family enzyme